MVVDVPDESEPAEEALFHVELVNARPSQDLEFNLLRKNLDLVEARSKAVTPAVGENERTVIGNSANGKMQLNVQPSPSPSVTPRDDEHSGSYEGHQDEAGDNGGGSQSRSRSGSYAGSRSASRSGSEHSVDPPAGLPNSNTKGGGSNTRSGNTWNDSSEMNHMNRLMDNHEHEMDSDFGNA